MKTKLPGSFPGQLRSSPKIHGSCYPAHPGGAKGARRPTRPYWGFYEDLFDFRKICEDSTRICGGFAKVFWDFAIICKDLTRIRRDFTRTCAGFTRMCKDFTAICEILLRFV